ALPPVYEAGPLGTAPPGSPRLAAPPARPRRGLDRRARLPRPRRPPLPRPVPLPTRGPTMTPARQRFLDPVPPAVAQGNRRGSAAPLPARGDVGYQGGGPDLCSRFCAELTAAGGKPQRVPDAASAVRVILELVQSLGSRRILLGSGPLLDTLALL